MEIEELVKNLKDDGYIVNVFENVDDANNYFCENIKDKTIGVGGSVTIEEMGLIDHLQKNNKVFWHWNNDDLKNAINTDIYLSSVNGISLKGEIVNIDGTGNRVASTIYGHQKVIFIFGLNKIANDLDSAINRARNIAAVKNAIRLKKNTPCTKTGKCMDCNSPERICRALSVLYKKPKGCEYEIAIIKQNLGY